eukprot:Skav209263  [mRNA]  locus=scaffold1552:53537:54241:+ [translate_table: standard]
MLGTCSAFRRFMPEARWRTPRAKQFFTNWQTVHVARQAAPLPPEVAMAFAGLALDTNQPELAAILLVGFLAFLRTGEMVSLSPTKIVVDVSTGRILLALPSTKTSKAREETVCVTDARVAALLARTLRTSEPLVWNGTRTSFRSIFQQFCSFFELEDNGFTPYSIRRGGASYAFAQGAAFDELLLRGRWQNNRTARLYLDTGRAALIQTRFILGQRLHLQRYVQRLERCCEQLR